MKMMAGIIDVLNDEDNQDETAIITAIEIDDNHQGNKLRMSHKIISACLD